MRQTIPMLAAVAISASVTTLSSASEVGSKAPELEPSGWINAKGPISWDRLKGRVIVVEKWATW